MPPSKVVKVRTSVPEEVNVGAVPPANFTAFPPPAFVPDTKETVPAPPFVIITVILFEWLDNELVIPTLKVPLPTVKDCTFPFVRSKSKALVLVPFA